MTLSNNYKVLRGFIDPEEADALGREWMEYCARYLLHHTPEFYLYQTLTCK